MYKNVLKKEKKKEKKDAFVDYGVAKRRFEGQICSEKSGDMPFSSPHEIFFPFFLTGRFTLTSQTFVPKEKV